MIKKQNKIFAVVEPDGELRIKLIAKLMTKLGFASIPSDALKIIKPDIYDYEIATSYFIACSNYNFRGSTVTTQRLYEMAARGICIVVGVKSVPREHEFICECIYSTDIN